MSSEVETSREFTVGYATEFLDFVRNDACKLASTMFQRIFIAVFVAVALAQFARADSPSVTAVLINSETTVGETVELQISVSGPGDAQAPEEIAVTGLEIYRTGENSSSQIRFGAGRMQVTRTITYTYTVLPKNAGRFTI